MSKNSKKERLLNQLDNKFLDMNQRINLPGLSAESSSRGWIWNIDLNGVVVSCSPEIEYLLGYKKDEVLGIDISSFSDYEQISLEDEEAQIYANYPIQQDVVFKSYSGKELPFSTQIFPQLDDNGHLLGWRGISISLVPEQKDKSQEKKELPISSLNQLLDLDEIPLPDTGELQMVEDSPESAGKTAPLKLQEEMIQAIRERHGLATSKESLNHDEEEVEDYEKQEVMESDFSDPRNTRSLHMEELFEFSDMAQSEDHETETVTLDDDTGSLEKMYPPAHTTPLNLTEEDIERLTKGLPLEDFEGTNQAESESDIPEVQASELIREFKDQGRVPPSKTAPLILDLDKEEKLIEKILANSDAVNELLNIIDSNSERVWEEDELILVNQVTNQLSLALENANLFQQTQTALAETDEQARRLQILNRLSGELSQASSLQEIYDLAVEKTQQMFQADRVSLSLLTPKKDGVTIVSTLGSHDKWLKGAVLPIEGTANQTAIEENRIIINPHTEQKNLGEIKSFILGPVSIPGEIIGTLNVGSYTPEAFTARDENFMGQLLALLGSIIENRQLFEAIEEALETTEEQARRLSLLNDLSERLGKTSTMEEVLSVTMEDIDKIIPSDRCSIAIHDEARECFQVFAVKGDGRIYPAGSDVPIENSILGLVLKENHLQSIGNLLEVSYVDTDNLAENGIRSVMSAPLFVSGKVIGTLNIGKYESFAYTVQDENLVLSISSLVSSTIDNRKLMEQIQRHSAQLETSAEVSRIASTILDTYELFPRVVELIKEGFELYYVGLFLVDQEGDWTGEANKWAVLRAGSGEAGQQMVTTQHKLEIGGDSMIGTAIKNAKALIALDVGEEAKFFRNPYLPDTRSEMALPLISRGEVLGALTIQSEQEAAFNQEDITALQTMADQVANTIENARLFEQSETRAEELNILNEMARAFTQTLDVQILIEQTYQYVSRLMDATNFYLAFYFKDSNEIEFKLFIDEDPDSPLPNTRMKLGGGITDWIITNKQPLLLRDNVKSRMEELGIPVRGSEPLAYLGVPMMTGNRIIGTIAVQSYDNSSAFSNHHLDLLSAIANQATVAIENARLFHQEQERATQERLVRTITDKVRGGAGAQSVMKIALEELSQVLNANISTIHLGTKEDLLSKSNLSTDNSKKDSEEDSQD
jgi:PAS domain S-box-containing protein